MAYFSVAHLVLDMILYSTLIADFSWLVATARSTTFLIGTLSDRALAVLDNHGDADDLFLSCAYSLLGQSL